MSVGLTYNMATINKIAHSGHVLYARKPNVVRTLILLEIIKRNGSLNNSLPFLFALPY
jgi:hypothetical protein